MFYKNNKPLNKTLIILKDGEPISYGNGLGITIVKNDINVSKEDKITFIYAEDETKEYTATKK